MLAARRATMATGVLARRAALGSSSNNLLRMATTPLGLQQQRQEPQWGTVPLTFPFSTSAAAAAEEEEQQQPAAAAAAAATTKSKVTKRRPPRKRIDPIVVTERAALRIQELLQGETAPEGSVGIRLGVKRRGCNGLSYTLNYALAEDSPRPREEVVKGPHNVMVYIEPMALFTVVGTTMDYEETDLAAEFTFMNPNSKGECGCGESFTV